MQIKSILLIDDDEDEFYFFKDTLFETGITVYNAYIERFNGSFRRDVLDAYLFESLTQVRIMAILNSTQWSYQRDWNGERQMVPASV